MMIFPNSMNGLQKHGKLQAKPLTMACSRMW
jgi:hypothetical protein